MARVIVVGSVSVDEIVFVAEGVREGAHLEGDWRGTRLGGGAANTGVALAHAGHDVAIVSVVGDDDAGRWILNELSGLGLDTDSIVRIPGHSTRSFIMVDAAGERTVVNLGRALESEPPQRLLGMKSDAVYVRSRSGGMDGILSQMIRGARVIAHIPPLADGSRPAHVVVTSASDVGADFLADPHAHGRRIAGDGLEWIVVTKGADGASAHAVNLRIDRRPPRVDPVDTTGAGDSFAAGLVHGLVSGMGMAAAMEVGNAWGAESTLFEASALPRGAAVFRNGAKSIPNHG